MAKIRAMKPAAPKVDEKHLNVAKEAFPDVNEDLLCYLIERIRDLAITYSNTLEKVARKRHSIEPAKMWFDRLSMEDAATDDILGFLVHRAVRLETLIEADEFGVPVPVKPKSPRAKRKAGGKAQV